MSFAQRLTAPAAAAEARPIKNERQAAIALLRLLVRSQQDLDDARVHMTADILEKRIEHLKTGSG